MAEVTNEITALRNLIKQKPCLRLRYCPYGGLVEDYPTLEKDNLQTCNVFGHQCPAWFEAEPFIDEG